MAASIGSLGASTAHSKPARETVRRVVSSPCNALIESCRDGSRFGQISVSPSLHKRGINPVRNATATARAYGANALDAFRHPLRKPSSNRAVRLLHSLGGGLGVQLFKLRTQDSRQRACRENIRASRKRERGQGKSCGELTKGADCRESGDGKSLQERRFLVRTVTSMVL